MDSRIKDISGNRFGSLIAVEYSHSSNGMAYWNYSCDCGKTHTTRANTVTYQAKKNPNTEHPSCGCKELLGKTKHGFRTVKNTHPAYRAYRSMMSRCYNPEVPGYMWYGAKGIVVCEEWKDNPEKFVKWAISNGWKKNLHIDKDILCTEQGVSPHIYSPETCQWVTAKRNVAFACDRDTYGKHPNVKLSHDDVAEIERLYFSGEVTNQSELARMFGLLSPSSIGRLIRIAKTRLV